VKSFTKTDFQTVYTATSAITHMARQQNQVRELDEGSYVMIDDAPCKITAYSTAKPGKHGSAKARVEGTGVFDENKRNFTEPVDAKVWVPIIQRKQGQVVSVESEDVAQVMALDTYETFTIKTPDGTNLSPDDEIEYLEMDEQRKII
jgi:translation initiation factor 5A